MAAACGGEDGDATAGGASVDCKAYLSEAPLGSLTMNVKNNRATAVYLGQPTCSSAFSITAPGLTSTNADLSGLDVTCEQAQKSGDYPLDCLDNSAVPIGPGEIMAFAWGGLLYESVMMPESCFGPSTFSTPTTCLQGKAPEAGMIEVTLSLYASATCSDMLCSQATDHFEVKKTVSYPAETYVQIDVD
jgi:hypothetical protein